MPSSTPLLLEPVATASPRWPAEIHAILEDLGAPANPLLFPDHFLQVTFPKLGGQAFLARRAGERLAMVFLFPRGRLGESVEYTARLHPFSNLAQADGTAIATELRHCLGGAGVVLYDPCRDQPFKPTTAAAADGFEIGHPDARQARAARQLQQATWGSQEKDLYPSDLYADSFGAATSLVARAGSRVVGFLFGFHKLAGTSLPPCWSHLERPLRIESQVAGVDPAFQGQGLGFLLKKTQAARAIRDGIEVVNWTVDPLQSLNASLNFGKLRAVSCHIHPNYYPFVNDKNRTPASRLEITWLPATARVQAALASDNPRARIVDLATEVDVTVVGVAGASLRPRPLRKPAARIAIEIPGDWDTLQQRDLRQARRWRAATDALLQTYIGPEEDRYMITDLGRHGRRWYLVATRAGLMGLDSTQG